MAKTKKQLSAELRAKYIDSTAEWLTGKGEEVLRTKSNEISIPCIDAEGNDEWIVISFKVPTGSRDDGEPYDGYGIAQQYTEHEKEKAVKAEQARAKKELKIARDKAAREAKAKAKAQHSAEKTEGT